MKRVSLLFLGVFCQLCFSSLALYALEQPEKSEPWIITLYTENDSSYYVPGSTADRYYTHGSKLTVTHQPAWGNALADKLATVLPIGKNEPVHTAVGYTLGQNLYSPDNISNATLNVNDRPYAGWFYGGMYLQRSVNDKEFDHLELNLGIIGPSSLADKTQHVVHKLFGSPNPNGWENQLNDEIGINFNYQHKWKFTVKGDNQGGLTMQAIPQVGFAVGNVNRNLSSDVTVRMGWNLPADFGPGRLDDVVSATTPSQPQNLSAYGFVRAGGRYVEHDLFISGNNDHHSHGVAEEQWVREVQYGIALAWKRMTLLWSNRHITKEFKQQSNSHVVGSWVVSYTHPF
ncbi:MAG: lipid A deacylase LpxR family protein [Phycisphaeraceae bacterium]|nr:lipid A deacylase LpxR family protein [Phycisphaeraceae bacterium]